MRSLCVLYSVVASFSLSTVAVHAQETRLTAPNLFPAKTLAYVRIDDVQQLKADLDRSSLGKLGNDEQLKPILMEFYGSLVRNTQQMQEVIGLNLDELLAIPSGELAIAVLPSDTRGRDRKGEGEEDSDEDDERERANSRPEPPVFVLLLDAGDEITGVQVILKRMEDGMDANMVHSEKTLDRLTLHRYANPNRRRQQFAYFIDQGVVIAASDAEQLEVLAATWLGQGNDPESLADNRKFTTIMSRCVGTEGERPQLSFYADPMGLIRQLVPRNAATTMTLAMLPALGLDGIEALGGSWIVAPPDFDSISHFHLLLASPRRAVLGLLRPKSGSTSPEMWVPDSVASYSTINWDIASTLQGVERLYNQFRGPDALQTEAFERANRQLELDVKRDILDNLEGRLTMLQGFVRPVTINSGSNVYAIRLKDPALFERQVLPKLLTQVEKRFEVLTESMGTLRVRVFEVGRDQPESAPVRQPEMCIALIDDYVVISDSRYMMRQIANCLAGVSAPLRDALEFQLIADRIDAQLQDRESAAMSYARPEESLQLFYELARDPKNKERLRGMSENNPVFSALYSALDKHDLPPFAVIAKYLAPGGGFLVEEEAGLHYMSFSLRRE